VEALSFEPRVLVRGWKQQERFQQLMKSRLDSLLKSPLDLLWEQLEAALALVLEGLVL
jgi:hypothetical protein